MGFTPEQARGLGLVQDAAGRWRQAPRTPVSLPAAGASGSSAQREAELHDEILEFCRSRQWPVVHSRMDRPATCGVGTPDFVVALPGGATVWVEAKRAGGKPTTAQLAWLAALGRVGHIAGVVRSLPEFIAIAQLAERRGWRGSGQAEDVADGSGDHLPNPTRPGAV